MREVGNEWHPIVAHPRERGFPFGNPQSFSGADWDRTSDQKRAILEAA
jgi:hypothetical protein